MPLHLLLLLILALKLSTSQPTTTTTTSLPPDAVALLTFKSKADLDNKLLYTTHDSPFDYCQWRGVKCAQGARVVRLFLPSSLLRGTLTSQLHLPSLRVLVLPNNSLSGPIPDLSPLVNLKTLVLHHNHFSSTLPPSLPSVRSLLVLDLSHNLLSGPLPDNLTLLDRLTYLKLDSNQFTGPIPPLNQTMMAVLDVSNNNLTGPIPVTQTLKKFKVESFLHNPGLCGEVINKPCRGPPFFNNTSGEDGDQSPPSSPPLLQQGLSNAAAGDSSPSVSGKHGKKYVGLVLGLVFAALILVAAVVSFVALVRKRKEEEQAESQEKINDFDKETTNTGSSIDNNKPQRERERGTNDTFFSSVQGESEKHEPAKKLRSPRVAAKSGSLVFCSGEEELYTLEQLMRASAELLGRGTFGTTYKAVMANQLIVTVKRLDAYKTAGTSGEAFEQHMETVGVLRHPNLVPVRAYFQAKQERLIVFEYQPNGSLFNLIHGSRSTRAKPLHWTSCLKIAEDVAQGLAYIHQASNLMHGNLKSTNVLLGPDFEACLTDYCLSVLADTSSDDHDPDYAGYRAPETRKSAHRASVKSDVYAFGVLLLELLTGKPPSQHPFLAPPDMPDWVRAMRDDDSEDDMRLRMLVEVASICSLTSPEQRPTMWQVLKMITNIKEIMDDGPREGNHGYS